MSIRRVDHVLTSTSLIEFPWGNPVPVGVAAASLRVVLGMHILILRGEAPSRCHSAGGMTIGAGWLPYCLRILVLIDLPQMIKARYQQPTRTVHVLTHGLTCSLGRAGFQCGIYSAVVFDDGFTLLGGRRINMLRSILYDSIQYP